LLDLGFKFVPSIFTNQFDFYSFVLNNLDVKFLDFNRNLFYYKKSKSLDTVKNPVNNTSSLDIESNPEDTFNHDFESILKNLSKFSKPKQSNNIRIQKETIDFRYELFKNLANNKFEFSNGEL
jgi:hypothetical protein